MSDYSDYRELPRTGRTPGHVGHECEPEKVDPSVLHDDRDNPDLLTFEKTWGHRVLAGISIAMLVISVILIAFCIIQIVSIIDVFMLMPMGTLGMYLYITGLICGAALIPPACIGIYVAKHPVRVNIAIVAAIVGLVLVAAFVAYVAVVSPWYIVTALIYALLLAALPVVYLVAALKIKRSL